MQFLTPENRKVLAYLRRYQDETILVVANLSHLAQQTQLDLSEFMGYRPVDLFGRVEFTPVDRQRLLLYAQSPRLLLVLPGDQPGVPADLPGPGLPRSPTLNETEESLFGKRENWVVLEAVLLDYIKGSAGSAARPGIAWAAEIQDIVPMHFENRTAYVVLLLVDYPEGEPETLQHTPVDGGRRSGRMRSKTNTRRRSWPASSRAAGTTAISSMTPWSTAISTAS